MLMAVAVVLFASAAAQNKSDSVSVLDAVTVTGIKEQMLRHTPFNVSIVSARQLRRNINYNVSDALAKLPGISQITTGPGISKPVIRGLYGNRIQTVLLGLRFDNQQWQDEHGLGLSIIGIDRIEVLKGPSSLLYGTEAMGGVIRIVEEAMPDSGQKESDIVVAGYSNTLGLSLNGGIKKNSGNKNWKVRIGLDSHADYSDGNNNRVLNSRFASYNLKASLGYTHKNWINENHFYSSFSRFGFVMEDNQNRKPVDGRASRKFDGPYHAVFFNILSSENTFILRDSKLELNGGIHSNLRLEDEGGSHISLNMFLNTFSYNARWFKNVGRNAEIVLGNESLFQINTNYGSRVIIPDATLFESSLSAYFKKKWGIADFETGLSFSERNVASKYTLNMDYSNGIIYPFTNWYPALNGNAGFAINTRSHWNIKVNASTGYRSANLAELSSNGVHEGTTRYEIGNPEMKAEENLNGELNINYEGRYVRLYSAVFLNLFRNYIYLSPTGTQYYGFDIYKYLQADARLYGLELSVDLKPTRFLALNSSFSNVTGKLESGEYLPFIPANKLVTDIVATLNPKLNFKVGGDFVSAQQHPGEFETSTPSYWLLHASIGWTITGKNRDMQFNVAGDNLLNRVYYDHLSRFKSYGIYNMGINFYASFSLPLN